MSMLAKMIYLIVLLSLEIFAFWIRIYIDL